MTEVERIADQLRRAYKGQAWRVLHSVVQHHIYHAGQISILKTL